jgi:CheY-like chemotaxis protein
VTRAAGARKDAAAQDVVSSVECSLLVEDAVARLRHDVFNSLAAVRNAAYYLQRRFNGTETWQADPRIEQFFQLIGQQLDAAVARIGLDPKAELPHQRRARVLDGAERVQAAIASLSEHLGVGQLSVSVESGRTRVDPEELELAVRASLSYLLETVPDGTLRLQAGPVEGGYQVVLEARAGAGTLLAAQPGALPRSCTVARRVAVAAGGSFALETKGELLRIIFSVPDGEEAAPVTRVLIVDDEVAGRATLAALLELDGHEVHECGTLAQARAALSSGEAFDAVLVDRKLPDGRGDTLAGAIQGAFPNAALVLMTGEAVDAPPTGFHAAHQKGMDPTLLTALVAQLLQVGNDV